MANFLNGADFFSQTLVTPPHLQNTLPYVRVLIDSILDLEVYALIFSQKLPFFYIDLVLPDLFTSTFYEGENVPQQGLLIKIFNRNFIGHPRKMSCMARQGKAKGRKFLKRRQVNSKRGG